MKQQNIRILAVSALTLCFFGNLRADVVPKNKSTVHYNIVYFEENFDEAASFYELHVFADSLSVIKDSAIFTSKEKFPAFKNVKLEWGKNYFWRVKRTNKKDKFLSSSELHKFKIVPRINSPYFDDFKIDVLTNKYGKHAGGFLLFDNLKGIFDRDGNARWLMPQIEGYTDASSEIRDLKFTEDNTLTFLSNNRPLEIDLNGNLLWSLPNPFVFEKDTILFHHDFKKTNHGTYLLLGNKAVYRKILNDFNRDYKNMQREFFVFDGEMFAKTEVAFVVEVTPKGDVIWFWDGNEYLSNEDLNFKKGPDGFPNMQTQSNAIGINYDNTKIYVGFRDLSRIIKIDKLSKKVEISYGQKYPSGEAKFGDKLFKQQHDAKPTNNNSILIFNNNGPKGEIGTSSILELRDNIVDKDSVVIWQFDLDFDTLTKGRSGSGGNVCELPNRNILLCAGQLNRVFEVTRNREIVWDAFTYGLSKADGTWQTLQNYRTSWVKDLKMDQVLVKNVSVSLTKNNSYAISILICNTQAFADSYLIEVHGNSALKLRPTESIAPNNLVQYKFELTEKIATEPILVIRSVNNPLIVKTINLDFKHSFNK